MVPALKETAQAVFPSCLEATLHDPNRITISIYPATAEMTDVLIAIVLPMTCQEAAKLAIQADILALEDLLTIPTDASDAAQMAGIGPEAVDPAAFEFAAMLPGLDPTASQESTVEG